MELNHLMENGIIRQIDMAFAGMIRRLDSGADPWIDVAAALVSRAANHGHVCLDLEALAGSGLQLSDSQTPVRFDVPADQWQKILSASALVGRPGEAAPLILDGSRLYLQRYWKYEQLVAMAIADRCRPSDTSLQAASPVAEVDVALRNGDHRQQRAVRLALSHRITVISGGPGTGKTYTIASVISRMRTMAADNMPRIKVAAPTGKAAARLQEALETALANLPGSDAQTDGTAVPVKAQTLHRLLGAVYGKAAYRYNAHNPLPADMVIVDEASMVDLALMARLVQALLPTAQLILVGDKDQLASVEAGAVLGDICSGLNDIHHGNAGAATGDSPVVELKKNYRFGDQSGIRQLGLAVNRGDGRKAMALLESSQCRDLEYLPMDGAFELAISLEDVVKKTMGPLFETDDPMEALGHLAAHKILTPLRKGPFGVQGLNDAVERILIRTGLIRMLPGRSPWYAGRPVMITRNDYHHNLYNGDIGITLVEKAQGRVNIRVAFPNDQQGLTYLLPEQLPEHETVYAMTVHKSQGTEFDNVLLVMPDKEVPVLSRELVYTAITRARRKVTIWSHGNILQAAVQRRMRRASGLRQALRANMEENS